MGSQYCFEAGPLVDFPRKRPVALFLDFDGTLVPIMKDPARPCLSPSTKGLLESLQGSERCVVVVTSGRSLADLRQKTRLRGCYHAGSHGLEISGPGMRFVHKAARSVKPMIDAICGDLEAETHGLEGVMIEKKPYSVALHYRSAGAETIQRLRRSLKEKIKGQPDYRRLLTVLRGKKVLEIAPRVSWDKGSAALWILEKLGGGYLPICLGDDRTDETLFMALDESGITVRVGTSRKTAARYYLKGQWEVPRFLGCLNEMLSAEER
jgi:trehalose 6-phosphate phosphatase